MSVVQQATHQQLPEIRESRQHTVLDRYLAMKKTDPELTFTAAADRLHVSVRGLRELVESLMYHDTPRTPANEVQLCLVWAGNEMALRGPDWLPAAEKVWALANQMRADLERHKTNRREESR